MTMTNEVLYNNEVVAVQEITPDNEERITWVKANEDCKKAVDSLDRSARELGSKIKDGIREAIKKQIGDAVNHPSHYTDGKIEVIDFIEDKKLGYHLGNVVKYVSRAGKKNPDKEIEDLKKARWYLNRYIERLESANEEKEV